MSATIAELAALIGGHVRGNGETAIAGAQSTADATPGDVTFAVDERNLRLLAESEAGAAIIPESLSEFFVEVLFEFLLELSRKTQFEFIENLFLEFLLELRRKAPAKFP